MRTPVGRLLGRMAALALLGGLAFAVWLLAARPFLDRLAALDEQVLNERRLLAAYRAPSGRAEAAQRRAAEIAALDGQRLLLEGESEAVKLAWLLAEIRRLAEGSAIRLESIRGLPSVAAEEIVMLGVEANLTATLGELGGLLEAIEASRPVLLVNGLSLAAAADAQPSGVRRLRIALRVAGATLRPASGAEHGKDPSHAPARP